MLAEAAQAERRRLPLDVMLRSLPAAASVLAGVALMAAALVQSADPRDSVASLSFTFGDGAARPLLQVLGGEAVAHAKCVPIPE